MMTKLDEYPQEGDEMSETFGTDDIITGRGLGIGGFGYGSGYGGGAQGAYSVGANAVRINASERAAATGLENLLDQNQFTATNKNVTDGFSRSADSRADNVNRVSDQQFRSELRASDASAATIKAMADAEFRSLDRQCNTDKTLAAMAAANAVCCCDTQKAIADAAKEAAKCCCDAQLQACKDHAALSALIIKENSATRELFQTSALATANAEIASLKITNALASAS